MQPARKASATSSGYICNCANASTLATYHVLEATHQQHLRLATLKAANDRVGNFIAQLPIFPYYSFGLEVLYGSVDGQKFSAAEPTLKARHSRKYFGKDRGVRCWSITWRYRPNCWGLTGTANAPVAGIPPVSSG
jgi:hypothetical protein